MVRNYTFYTAPGLCFKTAFHCRASLARAYPCRKFTHDRGVQQVWPLPVRSRGNTMTKEQRMEAMAPTPERFSHGDVEAIETIQAGVYAWQARTPSMLHRYWRDQLLSPEVSPEGDYSLARTRFDAGERLATLYESAGVRGRLMGVYGPRSHAYVDLSEHADDCLCDDCRQAAAFEAYQVIVRRLTATSPGVASAVVNLCIHDFDPVDRPSLIRGLDVLVRHWGM